MLKNMFLCSRKLPDIRDTFYRNLNFHDRPSKNTHISNLMKIRQVGAE